MRGKYTCGGYAGSLSYETTDANTFASWGVDYLKYDIVTMRERQLISYLRSVYLSFSS
jgi:hypothetical protein